MEITSAQIVDSKLRDLSFNPCFGHSRVADFNASIIDFRTLGSISFDPSLTALGCNARLAGVRAGESVQRALTLCLLAAVASAAADAALAVDGEGGAAGRVEGGRGGPEVLVGLVPESPERRQGALALQ